MAYKIAKNTNLDWEEILAWKIDQSGWGSLLQLNRFSEFLDVHAIGELMALTMSEDYTLSDVRSAVRSVTRYEAEFEDALTRIADGTSAGEESQFYCLATSLGVDIEVINGYLKGGITILELNQAVNFADRLEVDWEEIAGFLSLYGDS